ncbi:unnamed protein product [Pylaiella littoralis]
MPELPEVETSRLYVEEFCVGSTITKVHATEQGGGPRDGQFDDIVIGEGVTAKGLKSSLEGRKIVELRRRGKQMWFVLDKPPHPLFHFGMTGAFTVKGEKRHKFVKFKVDEEWPPRFAKLELQMSNGTCLALTDPRRLARVRLRSEPEASPPISLLGPDPLTHPLSLEVFAAALAKPTAPIKAVLLAQDRVVSGVGNWVADEVCFQAEVHPGAACNTLATQQVAALHRKLLSVCREACEAQADYTVFPKEWLFHHRWGKGKSSEGSPRVSSGHSIIFDVVGGRTTAIVPAVQKKGLLLSSSAAKSGGGGGSGPSSSARSRKAKPASAAKKASNAKASGGDGGGKGETTKAKAGVRKGKRIVDPKQEVEVEADEQEGGDEEGEEEQQSSKQKKSITAKKTVSRKTGRAGVTKARAAPVAKKGSGGGAKRKPVAAVEATAASTVAAASTGTARGGAAGRKKPNFSKKTVAEPTPAAAAAADKKVKAETVVIEKASKAKPASRAAVTPKNSGRGEGKATTLEQEHEDALSSVVVAPTKRGRGAGAGAGEDGGDLGSVKGKRAKTAAAAAAARGPAVKPEAIDATTVTANEAVVSKGRATRSARRVGERRSPRLSS